MHTLDTLFELETLHKHENEYHFRCRLNTEHDIFSGHFPEMPIVPGVCLLHAVKLAVSQIVDSDVSFLKIRECKFLSAINPTENSEFEIEFTLDSEKAVKAGIFIGKTQCMKLKATADF